MGRVIRDQVIASTALDKHGERLDEETLARLFEQVGPDMPLGVQHDTSQEPVVKLLDKHLVRLESGDLVITVDLEVLDERALAEAGGLSISFANLTHRYGMGEPKIGVLVNPRQFDISETCKVVTDCHPADCYDVVELVQKAAVLSTAIIAVVVYAGMQVSGGFFNAVGASLFEALRRLRRKDQPDGPTVVQFHLDVRVGPHVSQLILVVPADVSSNAVRCVSDSSIAELVAELPSGALPCRIVATVLPDGKLRLDRVIDAGH